MPVGVGLQYDFQINGLGFMLYRDARSKAQAWTRTGLEDAVSAQTKAGYSPSTGEAYGGFPDDIDHAEVYDDWSGGYGDYRQRPGRSNHYHLAFNVDTRFPRKLMLCQQAQMLPARYASVNINADFFLDVPARNFASPPAGHGTVLAVGRGYVAAFNPTSLPFTAGSAFDVAYEATGGGALGFGHRPAVFGSFTYIPNTNGSGFYQRGHDGTTYTLSSTLPARWFQVANGRLWRGHTRNYVQSIAAGVDTLITANWSATLSLANGQLITDDAMSCQDAMYVGFPNGLYQGDVTGTFTNVATDIGENVNIDNVRDITTHNGMVVFAEGAHVWGYTPSNAGTSFLRQLWPVVEVRSAATTSQAITAGFAGRTIKGSVQCLKGFGQWLYAGVFTGSNSQVFCGYEASAGMPYVWHPMQAFAETCKISRIHVDAITAASSGAQIPRRIWVATDATFGAQTGCTAPTYFWPIPNNDGDPNSDPTFSANYSVNQGYIEHPVSDWGNPTTWKVWRKVEVWWENQSNYQVVPQMVLDGSGSSQFTTTPLPGSAQQNQSKVFAYFKNTSNDGIGQGGQFGLIVNASLDGAGRGINNTVIRAATVRGTTRPRSNDIITAKVHIADGLRDRHGGEMRPGQTMLTELRLMALGANPFALVDLVGATYPVVVQPTIEEQEVYQGGETIPDLVAAVKIGVLDASWPVAYTNPIYAT